MSKLNELRDQMMGQDALDEARRVKKNMIVMRVGQDLRTIGKWIEGLSKFGSLPPTEGGDAKMRELQREGQELVAQVQAYAKKLSKAVRGS